MLSSDTCKVLRETNQYLAWSGDRSGLFNKPFLLCVLQSTPKGFFPRPWERAYQLPCTLPALLRTQHRKVRGMAWWSLFKARCHVSFQAAQSFRLLCPASCLLGAGSHFYPGKVPRDKMGGRRAQMVTSESTKKWKVPTPLSYAMFSASGSPSLWLCPALPQLWERMQWKEFPETHGFHCTHESCCFLLVTYQCMSESSASHCFPP